MLLLLQTIPNLTQLHLQTKQNLTQLPLQTKLSPMLLLLPMKQKPTQTKQRPIPQLLKTIRLAQQLPLILLLQIPQPTIQRPQSFLQTQPTRRYLTAFCSHLLHLRQKSHHLTSLVPKQHRFTMAQLAFNATPLIISSISQRNNAPVALTSSTSTLHPTPAKRSTTTS